MSERVVPTTHSEADIRRLKEAALPSHGENLSPPSDMSRRDAMRAFMFASSALALGLSGCERKPKRKIVSRPAGPEYQKPGKALYYASTWTEGPYPYGMVVKTVDGRPIKIDGNPDHPVNAGASTPAMQASVLSLYDPDRLRGPMAGGSRITWEEADQRVIEALKHAGSVVVITGANLGPSERDLLSTFSALVPSTRHFVHEAIDDGPRRRAWNAIYGQSGVLRPRFDKAEVIVSLGCDFLGTDGAVLENIRLFAAGRQLDEQEHKHAKINRLYVAEGPVTVTGSSADHRLRVRPSQMALLAHTLLAAVTGDTSRIDACASELGTSAQLLVALSDDLTSHRTSSLVVAGPHLPADVHATVAELNAALGSPGHTLAWDATPATLTASDPADMVAALDGGVDVAILLDVNPAYDWPGSGFATLLSKAKLSVGHGLYENETLAACSLALASHHNLESWNDAIARDGVHSICQPVIAPLHDSRQAAESMLRWAQAVASGGTDIQAVEDWHGYVQSRFVVRAIGSNVDGQDAWERSLRDGGVFAEEREAGTLPPAVRTPSVERTSATPGGYELVVLPHHALHDGRFATNGWLHELPDPISKLVWDNAAAISPHTAHALGGSEGDLVTITVGSAKVELPILVQPGMADGVVAVTLGHGLAARHPIVAEAGGANVAPLVGQPESGPTPALALSAKVVLSSGRRRLVRTQKEFSQHNRPIVLDGTLDEFRKDPGFIAGKRHLPEPVTMYPDYDYSKGHKWAMAIDLSRCVGCGSCVTACQAENNIPIVGRDECANGREMHWMRIDRYLGGDPDNPTVYQQPMLCQQCDNAPCENVCPVNATAHSPEGLNEMVYNRCVGTRYCANNCPYKVRRFNFLRYQEQRLKDPVQELVFNPQVTVRGVGVMEKCTFCVQRINEAKYTAGARGALLVDGSVQTACQQACPAGAIVFGDLNDPGSRIARLHASKRAYFVLEELNIKPNVAYLAQVRNPHPSLAPHQTSGGHHG